MSETEGQEWVTRSIGVEIVLRLVYRTNDRRTGKRERIIGPYNPEKEFSVALLAVDLQLQEMIAEEKEERAKIAARKAARTKGRKRKPTKKEKMLFNEMGLSAAEEGT